MWIWNVFVLEDTKIDGGIVVVPFSQDNSLSIQN